MNNEHELELGPLSAAITRAIHELSKVVAQAVGHGLAKGAATSPMPSAPATPPDRILTKRQVAELFQVSLRTVDNWIARHYLPHWRLGRQIRFRLRDVQEHLDAHHKIQGRSFRS